MKVICRLLFFCIPLPLPKLGLVKLLGPSIHVARRRKRTIYWRRVSRALAQVLELTFSRLDLFFRCYCSQRETEQSLRLTRRHMSPLWLLDTRQPAMWVVNFKFIDFIQWNQETIVLLFKYFTREKNLDVKTFPSVNGWVLCQTLHQAERLPFWGKKYNHIAHQTRSWRTGEGPIDRNLPSRISVPECCLEINYVIFVIVEFNGLCAVKLFLIHCFYLNNILRAPFSFLFVNSFFQS